MLADSLKEISPTWPRSEWRLERCWVFVKRGQNLVLLFSRGSRELAHAGEKLAHSVLQFGQSLKVDLLVVTGKRLQGAVDEVNDSGLTGTRRTVGRNDACGDGVDFCCLFWSKEFEFWRSGGASRMARVVCGGDSL